MAAKERQRKNIPWDVLVESAKSQKGKKWIAGNQCNWNHLKMKGMNENEKKICINHWQHMLNGIKLHFWISLHWQFNHHLYCRIVGGCAASHVPWYVKVQLPGGTDTGPSCGGVLINKFWILSAAHCFCNENIGECKIQGNKQIPKYDVTDTKVYFSENCICMHISSIIYSV